MTTATKRTAKKSAAKTSASKRTPAKSPAKTKPAKKSSRCWPGFEPVPGKKPMSKGSCKPKAHQSGGEKKADSRAAAASKREKGGG